mgnify:CR=1 FL=1
MRLYLADDAASAREPLRPAPIPRDNGYDEVVELSDAFMALERAVGVAWNASAPGATRDSAWTTEYKANNSVDWDAPYDPRAHTPGGFQSCWRSLL